MNLQKQVEADYITALKNKNTTNKNILGILKSELKNKTIQDKTDFVTDSDVELIITKLIKGISQTLELTKDSGDITTLEAELAVLKNYLPQMMDKYQIESIVRDMFENDTNLNIGSVMKRFSNEKADKKLVSQVFKELSTQ